MDQLHETARRFELHILSCFTCASSGIDLCEDGLELMNQFYYVLSAVSVARLKEASK